MNENDPKDIDPKDIDSVEKETAQETSRRDLLAAGAAAVVGVAAAVATPKAAKAAALGPGVWDLHGTEFVRVPNVTYAGEKDLVAKLRDIIIGAWEGTGLNTPGEVSAEEVRERLMSPDYTVVRTEMLRITDNSGGNDPNAIGLDMPRVISREMYNNGYLKQNVEEIVFVLPKPPGTINSKNKRGGSVRALMAAVPFGM